jgi:hypothetical protein
MKTLVLSLLTIFTLFLTGCLETTQEITINEDGSGTLSTTQDNSALLTLAAQMGQGKDMEKVPAMDSSFSLGTLSEKLTGLTAEEMQMLKGGTMKLKMNIKEEKFVTGVSFPFTSVSQIPDFNKLTTKAFTEVAKSQMEEQMKNAPAGMNNNDMPAASSMDDYYKFEFSNGELTRKVDKSKYAGVESDEFLKGLKQAAGMGLTVKTTYVINLPRPAEKAEGKNVKLSNDKKTVTVSASLDDFYDDPASLEFKIKY